MSPDLTKQVPTSKEMSSPLIRNMWKGVVWQWSLYTLQFNVWFIKVDKLLNRNNKQRFVSIGHKGNRNFQLLLSLHKTPKYGMHSLKRSNFCEYHIWKLYCLSISLKTGNTDGFFFEQIHPSLHFFLIGTSQISVPSSFFVRLLCNQNISKKKQYLTIAFKGILFAGVLFFNDILALLCITFSSMHLKKLFFSQKYLLVV